MPNYLNSTIATAANPEINTYRIHNYIRIPLVNITIPQLVLVGNGETIIYDDVEEFKNFGSYLLPAYQFEVVPDFDN